jgi:hypothetical protein
MSIPEFRSDRDGFEEQGSNPAFGFFSVDFHGGARRLEVQIGEQTTLLGGYGRE